MAPDDRKTSDVDTVAAADFYAWLAANLPKVFDDPSVVSEIGHRLRALSPELQWEAGPFDEQRTFFAFSPDCQAKLLPLTIQLAERAPEIPGWVILPAKPRKQWHSRCIEFPDPGGGRRRFEMDEWSYYLTSFKGGEFFDVNLVPRGAPGTREEIQHVGYMLVEFEIGERMFIEFIDRVNIIDQKDLKGACGRIDQLHDHLVQLIAQHPRQ